MTQTGALETPAQTKRKFSLGAMLVGLALVAFLAVVGWGLVQANKTRPERGAMAPPFRMEFFDGYQWDGRSSASLEDMKGQIVVLNFWASWCRECRDETALFEQAWRQHRDQGVIFVGVAYSDVEPKSLGYMEEFGVTFPNAPDLRSAMSRQYKITGVPETFFIDRQGMIRHVTVGPVQPAELDRVLAQLLQEGQAAR